MAHWYETQDADQLISPSLLFYPDRIDHNIDEMIRLAGTPDRLRPHVKTYKCKEIVQKELAKGIGRFKCATVVEAEMLAECGAKDVLIAYPLIGPAQKELARLMEAFPQTTFAVLIDHLDQFRSWQASGVRISFFVDIDVGMHRTGASAETGKVLRAAILEAGYDFRGWHVYDGHIREEDVARRQEITEQGMAAVHELVTETNTSDKEIICGGSVTFPIHAAHPERTLAPGTTLLWDHGYGSRFPDIPMKSAAVLLARVVSKPGEGRICLDMGHKAVASEMKAQPVFFPQAPEATIVTHSEEHLVLQVDDPAQWNVGDVMYGIPYHICPTVALHQQAQVIVDGKRQGAWEIVARRRKYVL
ncbi:MAG: D-TA family PLP-dependent enzyme [Bacteroidota bacterium]